MKLNDFLKTELLGNKFYAVKGYSEELNRETGKPEALRLNVSIQDDSSDFFMEMITVKVKTITPTLSKQEMSNNKTRHVILMETCGLTVLIFYQQKKIDNEGTKSLLVYLLYKQYFGEIHLRHSH